ncbi:MAG: FtsW/RodA/SpoVE family cell cycle protein [Clostridiales bacterium]|nr:FtsW/RodA/SpoVE family cell cycle protein [Clostridiales bacterium]
MSRMRSLLQEFFKKGDMLLLGLCLAASAFGLVLIYSATRWDNDNRSFIVQCVAIAIGVAAYFILTFVDIELVTEKGWKWMLLFNAVLMLSLLTPYGVGKETTGNNSWLALPFLPFNIQPSEVAKIFFVLVMAWQCSRLQERGISRPYAVMELAGHTLLMCGLIAGVSGDFGSALVYLFLFVIIAWSAGVGKRWFFLGILLAGALFYVVWPHLPDYIRMRILVVFDHSLDPQGKGFHQTRSILAIGSGQLAGQGYLQGTQTQASYSSALPMRHTDFIFSVCGEEFGLIGCALLLLLLTAIILRCFWVGRNTHSPMAAHAAIGYGGMLMLQTIFNVGMCLYILPVVGLTLPFISCGGSSIITLYAAMGVVSGIKMRSLPRWLRDH